MNETTINNETVDMPLFEQSETSKATGRAGIILKLRKVITQISSLPESVKLRRNRFADSLEETLQKVIDERGETHQAKLRLNALNEFEIEGLSKPTLHSFLLKAEELGKNIRYTQTIRVEISD